MNVVFYLSLAWIVSTAAGMSLSQFRNLKSRTEAAPVLTVSRNDEDAAASRVETTRCCGRQHKKQHIGYGLDGEELFVDVGHCRKTCSRKNKIHRREFEALLKANTSLDPVELFLSLQRDLSPSSCGEETSCEPSRTILERHVTLSGLQQVAVVEDCVCVHQPQRCQRSANVVVYFAETPFERAVDVGTCSGPCSDSEMGCRSVRNRTVTIEGPNGHTCVEVIEECSCTSGCYRASLLEHVYDYSNVTDDSSEADEPTVKVIDIGQCVGICDGPQRKQQCVLRDTEDSTKCLMSLSRQENNCAPLGFDVHRYRSKNGLNKNVLSITECGCQ